MDADSRQWPKSTAIESHEQRRLRLARNRRQRELYGPAHHRRRQQFERRIEAGLMPICPRCGRGIGPDELWDLGHDDVDLRVTRPEHRACNRAAANELKTSRE